MKICSRPECEVDISHKDYRAKFCSSRCSALVSNTTRVRIRKVKVKPKSKIDQWLDGEWDGTVKAGLSELLRKYLIEVAEYKCQDGRSGCNGWSGINPKSGKTCLTVDHIDGNAQNNKIDNLKVMCPNCHSMTITYGALNKGNGRSSRYNP